MESAHSILTVFRPKSWHLFRLHYEVSTNLALLQSNVNYMNSVCGMNYHWLSDLYQCLSIPILGGNGGSVETSKCETKQMPRFGPEHCQNAMS